MKLAAIILLFMSTVPCVAQESNNEEWEKEVRVNKSVKSRMAYSSIVLNGTISDEKFLSGVVFYNKSGDILVEKRFHRNGNVMLLDTFLYNERNRISEHRTINYFDSSETKTEYLYEEDWVINERYYVKDTTKVNYLVYSNTSEPLENIGFPKPVYKNGYRLVSNKKQQVNTSGRLTSQVWDYETSQIIGPETLLFKQLDTIHHYYLSDSVHVFDINPGRNEKKYNRYNSSGRIVKSYIQNNTSKKVSWKRTYEYDSDRNMIKETTYGYHGAPMFVSKFKFKDNLCVSWSSYSVATGNKVLTNYMEYTFGYF